MPDKNSFKNKTVTQRILDAQGLYCPEPVMLLHNAIREMSTGEVIKVIATDPSTQRDIPKFCQFLGHTLLEKRIEHDGAKFIYLVCKADKKPD